MKKLLVLGVITAFLLVSCKQNHPDGDSSLVKDGDLVEQNEAVSDSISGVYVGVLPCADCEGIRTEIVLHDDYSYEITSLYLGTKSDVEEFVETGSWDLIEGIIELHDHTQGDLIKKLRMEPNGVRYLDLEGEMIQGSLAGMYVLTKQ